MPFPWILKSFADLFYQPKNLFTNQIYFIVYVYISSVVIQLINIQIYLEIKLWKIFIVWMGTNLSQLILKKEKKNKKYFLCFFLFWIVIRNEEMWCIYEQTRLIRVGWKIPSTDRSARAERQKFLGLMFNVDSLQSSPRVYLLTSFN